MVPTEEKINKVNIKPKRTAYSQLLGYDTGIVAK